MKRRSPSPSPWERKGWQQGGSPRPVVTPALLHLRAVACRSAGHATVPASGTWWRPQGKATKPCHRLPPLREGRSPRRGRGDGAPPKGHAGLATSAHQGARAPCCGLRMAGRYGRQRCGLWGATTHVARSYPPQPYATHNTAPQATAGVRRARATTLRSARL